jgi:hypothetical protein
MRKTFWESYTYNKIELMIILKMSRDQLLLPCIAFKTTTFAATRLFCSIKSFLQTSHLLNCSKSNITNRSYSLLVSGNTVAGISSCFVYSPRRNNRHFVPLHQLSQPALLPEAQYPVVLVGCYKFGGRKPFLIIRQMW